jgi:hypothetical protein
MVAYSHLKTPFDENATPFSDTVSRVCRSVKLLPPMFTGRLLPSDVPTVRRWGNETIIEWRHVQPVTDTVIYKKMYPSWRKVS